MSTPRIRDGQMFSSKRYPNGTVLRVCVMCDFADCYGPSSGRGRGAGFVRGNKARGKMIHHFKTAHAPTYALLLADVRAAKAALK